MKQWRDDIKRFFATYFMINYEQECLNGLMAERLRQEMMLTVIQ